MLRKLLAIVFIAAILLVGMVVSAPLYLPGVLSHLLAERGLNVSHIRLRVPGVNTWVIPALHLQSAAGIKLEMETLVLHYQLGKLIGGRVDGIDIKTLTVRTRAQTTISPTNAPQPTTVDSTPTFPMLERWLETLPVNRITVDDGNIDGKIVINQFDLQKISDSLVLEGRFTLDDNEIQIAGKLEPENRFQLSAQSSLGQLAFAGGFDAGRIRGEGNTEFDIALIKPWLPSEFADIQGKLISGLSFELLNKNSDIDLQTDLTLKGRLTSPTYFDELVVNQQLRLSGPAQSPQLTVVAGDSVAIRKLRKPVEQNRVMVGLTSDLEINDIVNNFTVAEKAAVQIRTDKDSLDIVFNGKHIAVNGNLSSVAPDLYLSSDMVLESSKPLRLRVLSGGTASLGDIPDLGNTTAQLDRDLVLTGEGERLRLEDRLQLSFKTETTSFTLQGAGDIQPVKLKLSLNTDNLNLRGEKYGVAVANIDITQNEILKLVASLKVLDTDISAEGAFDPKTMQGQFTAAVDNLSQLNSYFARQCIEISQGNVQARGEMDFTGEVTLHGDLRVNNLSLSVQEKPVNNLRFTGQWSYSAANQGQGFNLSGGLQVPEVEVGIEVQNLIGQLQWQGDNITIDKLEGQTLGGRLYSEKQRWQLGQQRNELILYLNNIDLSQLVALEDYSGLDVSGRINVTLPLVVDSARIQVVGGRIDAVQPGGEIHLPVDGSNRTGAQKEAFEALQNFHYEVLSGGLSGPLALDPNGLLVSQLTLKGRNPDMGRPVTLNLTIEQNTYPIFQTLELFNRINRIGQCSPH